MAFDAGMVRALVSELNIKLKNARVDKIQQPEREELVFTMRANGETVKLSVCSAANNPRVNITSENKDNPLSAPMFCMLLRKHLCGSRVVSVSQYDFERVIEILFECRDELGDLKQKYIIVEIMGKYSNIIFCDKNKKIISAIKSVDFTTSSKRQVLPGMIYEYPPKQDKINPMKTTKNEFFSLYKKAYCEKKISQFISDEYCGISKLVSNEIAYICTGDIDAALSDCSADILWEKFCFYLQILKSCDFTPYMYKINGEPEEFCFMRLTQFENMYSAIKFDSFSKLIDEYYMKKDRANHIKQISSDLNKYLSTNESRILKKISIHKNDIKNSNENLKFKNVGDIITSNIYMIKKGDTRVNLLDYSSDPPINREIDLDSKLTPSQNAQKYYKRYNKAKKTIEYSEKQLENDEKELMYIRSVIDALSRIENENDIEDLKKELYSSGYSVKIKLDKKMNYKTSPMEFRTQNGYKVLCGRNNIQNDALTFKTASKSDYWFHVKNIPGSHCILICNGQEPNEVDFTQAAIIAATYSKAVKSENVAVDYTHVKNIKKIPSSKPGLVIYSTNYTAYVTPDENLCEELRVR